MIRTALASTAVVATIAGSALLAPPAYADNGKNHGHANKNSVTFNIVGGYGITVSCNTVAISGQSSTECKGNQTNSGGGNGND